jgi:hypothetical protein
MTSFARHLDPGICLGPCLFYHGRDRVYCDAPIFETRLLMQTATLTDQLALDLLIDQHQFLDLLPLLLHHHDSERISCCCGAFCGDARHCRPMNQIDAACVGANSYARDYECDSVTFVGLPAWASP